MTSYKRIVKTIAGMEKRLCADDPSEILNDILVIAKQPILKEREKNRVYCKRHREKHREEYNLRHKLWQREYNKKRRTK